MACIVWPGLSYRRPNNCLSWAILGKYCSVLSDVCVCNGARVGIANNFKWDLHIYYSASGNLTYSLSWAFLGKYCSVLLSVCVCNGARVGIANNFKWDLHLHLQMYYSLHSSTSGNLTYRISSLVLFEKSPGGKSFNWLFDKSLTRETSQ